MNDDPQAPSTSLDKTLARIRIEQWQHERTALNCGRVRNYKAPGRPPANGNTNRYDAALVRCIDFEREFASWTPTPKPSCSSPSESTSRKE